MVKKFSSKKINGAKMPSFFLRELKLIEVLLLICNSYMSRRTRFFSPKLCGTFHFQFGFFFVKVYIFFNKMHGVFDCKTSYLKKQKNHTQFCSQTFDFQVATRSFKIHWYLRDLATNFLNPENRSLENVSIATFE